MSYLFLFWIYPPLYTSRFIAMLLAHQKLVFTIIKPSADFSIEIEKSLMIRILGCTLEKKVYIQLQTSSET